MWEIPAASTPALANVDKAYPATDAAACSIIIIRLSTGIGAWRATADNGPNASRQTDRI
jgi:hypothetical protein